MKTSERQTDPPHFPLPPALSPYTMQSMILIGSTTSLKAKA